MECYVGYVLDELDEFPKALVGVEADPGKTDSEAATAVMKRILLREGWNGDKLDGTGNAESWPEAWREISLASILPEDDHITVLQHFFVESLDQLAEELSASRKERPNLPWNEE